MLPQVSSYRCSCAAGGCCRRRLRAGRMFEVMFAVVVLWPATFARGLISRLCANEGYAVRGKIESISY